MDRELKTKFEGEAFLHRLLWQQIVEPEAKLVTETERGSFNHTVVAMVFAFHTVEAYLNFIGEKLAPEIWKDERNYFRAHGGVKGKLQKVMELVGLPWSLPDNRPLKTILELKDIRDLIAHGRTEKLEGEILHSSEVEIPFPTTTLRNLVRSENLSCVLEDVENFLNQIHRHAKPKVQEVWFGSEALRGPIQYNQRTSAISGESTT